MIWWVASPRLWAAAMKAASKKAPFLTAVFWRETKDIYIQMGGQFFLPEEDNGAD